MAEKITIDRELLEQWMHTVNHYMDLYSAHPFDGLEVGAVLEEATATRGKMLRPRLLLLAAAFGPEFESRKERLCKLAAMVELTHMASLIHDDIVDDAPSRRGKPSLQHRYGKNAAVYAGDYLMSRISYHVATEDMNRPGAVMARTVEEMCAGEIGQSRCRYREDMTLSDYMRNIHGKTAALFMAACRIGAEESGCGAEVIRRLEEFAECLGIMFQLKDDLMDFTSDARTMGKEAHKDFREGIYTMPVLWVLQYPQGKEQLLPILKANAAGTLTDDQLAQMEQLVERLGGVQAAWDEIRRLQKNAESLLRTHLPQVRPSADLMAMVRKLGKDL
ncbi:MAG: polyprenyl synthetase family protein [Enterocloster asparagiformis]|nr:polyprenyl synthetase family protein [Enterocloster asparagiformis]